MYHTPPEHCSRSLMDLEPLGSFRRVILSLRTFHGLDGVQYVSVPCT